MTTLKEIKFKLPTFYTKEKSFEDIDAKDYVVLAKDKTATNAAKTFTRLPISKFKELEEILKTNSNYYEILPIIFPVKPYFDLEMEYSGLSYETSKNKTEIFISWLITEIKNEFDIELERSDFIKLDSCRENKLSFHVIIQNKMYFENVSEHKTFILYVKNRFNNPKNQEEETIFKTLTWVFKKKGEILEERRIFDVLPYGSDQNFRLVNQSKKGKLYVLKNETEYLNTDTLVRLYFGVGDRIKIAVDRLGEKMITKNIKKNIKTGDNKERIKKQHKNDIEDIDDFVVNGETLMQSKNMTFADVKKLPEYLQYLYLIPNSVQSFSFFMKIAFAIKGSEGVLADLLEWWALYDKDEEEDEEKKKKKKAISEDFTKKYNNGKGGKSNTYGLATLKKYAKIANPEYFVSRWEGEEIEVILKGSSNDLLEKYFNPNYENIKIIVEDCLFVSQKGTKFENNIMSPEKIIILQAYLGKGKTTAIKRLLPAYKRILFLSPRIAFSKFLCKDFESVCYLDDNLDADKLVMSMEGLHKLSDVKDYDCIIFDECEDNLGVFASATMKQKQVEIYNIFCGLIKNCKKFIMASAFITDKSLNFARSLKMPVCLIRNTTLPQKRVATEINVDLFNLKLYESIKKGEKNFAVWCSLTAMKGFMGELEGGSRENEKLEKIKDNMLIYSSEVDDLKFDTLNEIEREWGKAPLVMTTPSITVGNSYSTKDFDSVWINGSPTCIVPQTFQGHMRVRNVKTNSLKFCLPTEKMLKFHKNRTEIRFKILAEYDSMTDQKRKVMADLTRKLIENKQESKNLGLLEVIERFLTTEYQITPEPLRELLMFNLMEQSLSQKYYKEMFFQFLKMCNYDVEGIKPSNKGDEENACLLKVNKVINPIKYDEIEEISEEVSEEIRKLQEKKKATSIQKLQLRRYYFDNRIDLSLSLEDKEFYFELDEFSYNKAKLNNAYFEAKKGNEDMENDVIGNTQKTGAELGLNMIYAKLQYIREINQKLGLINSSINDITITRKKIEEIDSYLLTERKSLHTLFNLKDKSIMVENDTNRVRKNVELLNKVYQSWSGMKIVAEDNKGRIKDTFVTKSIYGDKKLPYSITCNGKKERKKGVCLIDMNEIFGIPILTAKSVVEFDPKTIQEIAIAEPLFFLVVENDEVIEEAEEILIPKKKYDWCSPKFLENERLGISQSPPPIIWKRRIRAIII